ncbi:hypothetical protein LOK49_Contig768G00001 [Camellia lanceoleosa]|nr:hypothetical protein LOK49_Contig768G00001 [Camellia lanceoleosa]
MADLQLISGAASALQSPPTSSETQSTPHRYENVQAILLPPTLTSTLSPIIADRRPDLRPLQNPPIRGSIHISPLSNTSASSDLINWRDYADFVNLSTKLPSTLTPLSSECAPPLRDLGEKILCSSAPPSRPRSLALQTGLQAASRGFRLAKEVLELLLDTFHVVS